MEGRAPASPGYDSASRELRPPNADRAELNSLSLALKLNQAATCCVSHRFSPADDVELGENAFHMRLHRALANEEGRADLFVAFSLRHQLEDIDFALAQGFAADALHEFGRKMHRHASFAAVHPANAIH